MTVWVTVLPAASVALARSDAKPSPPGCTTAADQPYRVLRNGVRSHVRPSSYEIATLIRVTSAAGAPGWRRSVTDISNLYPAGAPPRSSNVGMNRTTWTGSFAGV